MRYIVYGLFILAIVMVATIIHYEKRNQKLMNEKCETCKWYSDEYGGICNHKGIFTSGKYNACGDWREK